MSEFCVEREVNYKNLIESNFKVKVNEMSVNYFYKFALPTFFSGMVPVSTPTKRLSLF